ncbi:MAG: hypothetical protein V1725_00700 [archaeon]
MRVFLDTNSLMLCFERRLDIFTEAKRVVPGKAELFVVEETLQELTHLAEKGEKLAIRQAAKLAIILIKQQNLKRLRGFPKKSADDAILARAGKEDYVLTQDKELKARLKGKGVGVLAIRNKDHIIVG